MAATFCSGSNSGLDGDAQLSGDRPSPPRVVAGQDAHIEAGVPQPGDHLVEAGSPLFGEDEEPASFSVPSDQGQRKPPQRACSRHRPITGPSRSPRSSMSRGLPERYRGIRAVTLQVTDHAVPGHDANTVRFVRCGARNGRIQVQIADRLREDMGRTPGQGRCPDDGVVPLIRMLELAGADNRLRRS